MELSIIIVNYKSAGHVINCIESIRSGARGLSYELLIVDNASNDGSKDTILSVNPEAIWIQSDYNAGFARANNMGIRMAKGRNILLLNADTIIVGDALTRAVQLFESKPGYSACGLQLLNLDGTPQHSGARFVKGGLNNLRPLPYLGIFLRSLAFSTGVKQPNVFEVLNDEEVDWIVGAFLMARKTAIEKAGLLDEDFFMYAEEIEWCSRLRKTGPMILFHEPKVIHLGGGSSKDFYSTASPDNSWDLWSRKGAQIILSQFLRIRKQWGWPWFVLHFCIFLCEIPFFAILMFFDNLFSIGKKRYDWKQWVGYTKNMLSIFPFFPSILFHRHRLYKIN